MRDKHENPAPNGSSEGMLRTSREVPPPPPASGVLSSLFRVPRFTPRADAPATHEFRVSSSAFTTIELLIVLIIAFLILALIGILWRHLDERNNKSRAQTQLAYLQTALQDYRNETGAYPQTLDLISNRLPRAFTAFNADGVPLDPWNAPYWYTNNTNTYTLFSCGPDGADTNATDNIYPGRF